MAEDFDKIEDLQRLFLIEFLVDNVKLNYEKIDLSESTLNLLKQTCVKFKFLDFPMIEVCEEDFCDTEADYNRAEKIVFKNGKSYFFSLNSLPPNTSCLQLGAIVLRKKGDPPPVVMGTSCIVLDEGFMEVLNGLKETDEASKSLQDIFPITDERGIIVGSLTVLVRLSCFGKAIVTNFKIPEEEKSGYMFANTKDQGRGVNPAQISKGYTVTDDQVRPPECDDMFYPGTKMDSSEDGAQATYPENTGETAAVTPQASSETPSTPHQDVENTSDITPQSSSESFPDRSGDYAVYDELNKNENLQRLFLLELLVDNVKFYYEKVDLSESTLNVLKHTCVRFSFLDFPMIQVCEEDFCESETNLNRTSKIVFKNGKSYFFSLNGIPVDHKCLNLGAIILRKKKELPPVVMGTSCIVLDKGFVDVLNGLSETYEASKSLKDIFPIFDERGIIIGSLTVLVRLSSFGKAIITQFKVPDEEKAGYLFANTKDRGRKLNPPDAQKKTPIFRGHPDPKNRVSPTNGNNILHPGIFTGPRAPEVVLGSTPMDVPSNAQKTLPMIYRGFPNTAKGDQTTLPGSSPGVYYANVLPQNMNTQSSPAMYHANQLPQNMNTQSSPAMYHANAPHPNMNYQALPNTFPHNVPGMYPINMTEPGPFYGPAPRKT